MSTIFQLDNINEVNSRNGQPTAHPLVTVLDLSKTPPAKPVKINFGLYAIFLKDGACNPLKYGRHHYDYQNGTLVFMAPGQTVELEEIDENGLHQPSGWVLFFHPDLIRGTSLGQHIKEYSFFSYQVNEALHISELERHFVLDCFLKIRSELDRPIDKHSKKLVVSHIELLLNYCVRFYDRQFIIREHVHKGIVVQFEELLDAYFQSEQLLTQGLPSVAYCAEKLNLSPKYFGDLIKKETGRSALDYIQLRLLDLAKERIFDPQKSVSEIAYELGFKYPQHFTRFFKQKVGLTPNEFRMTN